MSELKPIIEQSMVQYAGAVLQSRALVDVRDCLKPSARQIFYSMLTHKLTSDYPHKKTTNAIGLAMVDFYIHGDSSCEGVIMRAGEDFALRYPLIDVSGNCGSLIESGSWAASRYTESRLAEISTYLFKDIDKNTIEEWRDNYDNTKQYPSVLPSKGFYNIVNGSMGIGIGMASSIPQFNLKEVNNALVYLIDHPDCSFEEIWCAPDFATGGILYNENQVKESLKNGTGFACKLRSVIEYDQKERCLTVVEMPYGVYTNTVCEQLTEIEQSEDNPGIERHNDLTGKKANLKIYLTKEANPDRIIRYLYKNTSLQYYFGINFTMLDKGRFPKVFTWKEALWSYIEHEKEVYRRGFEFDLNKINHRIHIIDGLLICLARIDEVIAVIKSSSSTDTAAVALQKTFLLDAEQAKAVLDMKLSKLAHLEVQKLENEKENLEREAHRIEEILNNELLFNNELKKDWIAVAEKYGDERRTKIINLDVNANDEPIEVKQLQLSLTNFNNILATETSTLYTQKRGGVGNKIKLANGEFIINSLTLKNTDTLLLFSKNGSAYKTNCGNLIIGEKINIINIIPLKENEQICSMVAISDTNEKFVTIITKNGLIKKSTIQECVPTRNMGIKVIALDNDDEIVSILITSNDHIGLLSKEGNFLIIATEDINAIGRNTKGIKAIKLNAGDKVIAAHLVNLQAKSIVSISRNGLIKQTLSNEFVSQGRGTKGSKIQKFENGDFAADFLVIEAENDLLIVSSNSCIKLSLSEIQTSSRGAQGSRAMKLSDKDRIVALSKI